MARNVGDNSLNRFPLDTDFFRDPVIIRLGSKLGRSGVLTLIQLFDWIYDSKEGYYQKWSEDSALIFAISVCYDASLESEVSEVVKQAVASGIFDKECFEKYGILTSRRIQQVWRTGMLSSKRDGTPEDEYCLLDNIRQKKDSPDGNTLSDNRDSTESQLKVNRDSTESQLVNNIKENNNKEVSKKGDSTFEKSGDSPDEIDQSDRRYVRLALIAPGDCSVSASLIDRICLARAKRINGFNNGSIRKMRADADAAVIRFNSGDTRTGLQYRWQSIVRSVKSALSASGYSWKPLEAEPKEQPPTAYEVAEFEKQLKIARDRRRDAELEQVAINYTRGQKT